MTKRNVLRLIGGICTGLGIGTCMGVAMHHIFLGMALGAAIGLCFACALGAFKKDEPKDD